jgi:hypothetical protein
MKNAKKWGNDFQRILARYVTFRCRLAEMPTGLSNLPRQFYSDDEINIYCKTPSRQVPFFLFSHFSSFLKKNVTFLSKKEEEDIDENWTTKFHVAF